VPLGLRTALRAIRGRVDHVAHSGLEFPLS
jgi:hypothetical protein